MMQLYSGKFINILIAAIIEWIQSDNFMLFRYDSTHVGLHRDENVTVSETEDGKLLLNGNKITVFAEKDPKLIPWGSAGK